MVFSHFVKGITGDINYYNYVYFQKNWLLESILILIILERECPINTNLQFKHHDRYLQIAN